MADVSAEEVATFLFRSGVHPSELILVDRELEGRPLSTTLFRQLRVLMFLRRGRRNVSESEVHDFGQLIMANRVRRHLLNARIVNIGIALCNVPAFRHR